MGVSGRFFWWLLRKVMLALGLAGLALFALGWWSYQREGNDYESHRREVLRGLTLELARLRDAAETTAARMAAARVEIAAQKERAAQAGRVARQIEDLGSGLNRLTTSAAQQAEDEQRRTRMKQMEKGSFQRATELEQGLVHSQWEKDGIEIAVARKQQELAAARADRTLLVHYARVTWTRHGRWVLVAAGLAAIAPFFLRRRRARTEVAERA